MDDLKEAWMALDNRLKKNEELKESIILEIIQGKVEKLIKRWLHSSIFGVIAILLLIPLIVYLLERYGGSIWFNAICYWTILFCVVSFVVVILLIRILLKIDFVDSLGNNILNINKYNIFSKRSLVMVYIYSPISFLLCIFRYAELNATLSLWAFLIGMFLSLIIFAFVSIKTYNKNFKSIIKSLNEIKELKEE